MKTADFNFDLPADLIAQYPAEKRGADRMLVLDRAGGALADRMVSDLPDLLEPGTLMVFNDSRVRKARIFAESVRGGAMQEFLLINRLGERRWSAMAKRFKRLRTGSRYRLNDGSECEIAGEQDGLKLLDFSRPVDDAWLDINGRIPLPPYIRREVSPDDEDRYQTVYAKNTGSAAAPTAGLHFTEELTSRLQERGVKLAWVTLHVGLGTFLPVRTENIEDHSMHEECFTVPPETAAAVSEAKEESRTVLAVGTTSVRTLESAWNSETQTLRAGSGSTNIFIYPGYRFNVADALFTNFHTPESTLVMLVSAFAGKERLFGAYEHAVRSRYRFFSYGDAMLIR